MRHSLILFAGLLVWSIAGCATEEEVASTPAPVPKLSRRDARIAASRYRHAERRAKAAEVAQQSNKGVSSSTVGKGQRGRKNNGEAARDDEPGSVTTTTFVESYASDLEALEELERLWTEVARLAALPSPEDRLLTNAIAALHSYSEWTLEQMDQRADKSEAATIARVAVVHYLRATECMAKARMDTGGRWERAHEQHQLAVDAVSKL